MSQHRSHGFHIRQAVVLAAGRGSRLRSGEASLPKPLTPVAGVPLIERTILTLAQGGIERVYVTVGFRAELVRQALAQSQVYAARGVQVVCIDNDRYDLGVGVSVLSAREHVSGPFVLSMSDHVYDRRLAELAARADMAAADLYLCVDRNIDQVYDIDDATKVALDGDRIADIGKQLTEYDAIDCGVFAMTPRIFEHLDQVYRERGDCSLSDGVQRLAAEGRARVLDIGDAFWQDVDTPGAMAHAEDVLGAVRGGVSARAQALGGALT